MILNNNSMDSKTRTFLLYFLSMLLGIILLDNVMRFPNENGSYLFRIYLFPVSLFYLLFIPLIIYQYLRNRKTNINYFWKFFCTVFIVLLLLVLPNYFLTYGLYSIITLNNNSLLGYYIIDIIQMLIYNFLLIKLFYRFILENDKNINQSREFKPILIKLLLLESISGLASELFYKITPARFVIYTEELIKINQEYFVDYFTLSYLDIVIPSIMFFYALYILYKDDTILTSDIRTFVSVSGVFLIGIILISDLGTLLNNIPNRVTFTIGKIIVKLIIPILIFSGAGYSYFSKSSKKESKNVGYCKNCGHYNNYGNTFCSNCGSRIT